MKKLVDILENVSIKELLGNKNQVVSHLCFDSRKVSDKACFFARKGVAMNGHDFIPEVIVKGATTIVCEVMPEKILPTICYILVEDASVVMGQMASSFYDHPSRGLKLIGITGTNGKTTCVSLLHQLFSALGIKAGLVSTVVNKIGDAELKATHTTPDSIELNDLLAKMVAAGCAYCFMEVSSHAVSQKRIAGIQFYGAAFTNITHDHLDYHHTFANYLSAKQAFFNQLDSSAFALSNMDDRNGEVMLQNCKAEKHFYGLKSHAEFKTKIVESNFAGLSLKIDNQEFWSPLIGQFNAYNLTTVYAVAVLSGLDRIQVLTALSTLNSVAGRFQHIHENGLIGIVDYAHTPDALENVLKTIKGIRTGSETVLTIVGCGGDRDRTKRPLMAEIACKLSDRVILTSDNPRTEDPESILNEMKTGVSHSEQAKVLSILNRREAIRTAVSLSKTNDILLIAGKGHENYQEIMGVRTHFDDMEELKNAINELKQVKI